MDVVTSIALGGILLAALLALVRLLRGPSVADRIVALDLILLMAASGLAVWSVRTGSTAFLNALVVTALIGFVGTVTVARFIERRGARGL